MKGKDTDLSLPLIYDKKYFNKKINFQRQSKSHYDVYNFFLSIGIELKISSAF